MKILLSGGGTLGSVTPLLALVNELIKKDRSNEFFWLGTKTGPERILVEQLGINFITIPAGKWRRYFSLQNVIDIIKIILGLIRSLYLLHRFKPQVVVVAGGFVGVPVGWAAWLRRIPLIIHQQDVRPSLASRLLSWCATRITVTWAVSGDSFPQNKISIIGNPVRDIFFKSIDKEQVLKDMGFNDKKVILLIVGGGTGASFFNQLISDSLDQLTKICQIIHITGLSKSAGVKSAVAYKVFDMVTNDMPKLLLIADLVLSRAGMGLISELAFFTKPSIIVPLPNTHQEDNAQYLDKHDAAMVISQSALTVTKLVNIVQELNHNKESFASLGTNLKRLFPEHANQKLAELVIQVVK
ncbi:MAG: undecaprenyldiphospho-muramoylpentapeptide beta-N-acetylglucosaminyltransferase [Patescibacteria group bacterium]